MLKTQNYNLNKPVSADPMRVSDFNENADIIDAALKDLNTAVENAGNCKIASGSYAGTGIYGSGSPKKITFPFVPKWVYIMLPTVPSLRAVYVNGAKYMTTQANGSNSQTAVCTLSGSTLSWYNTSDASYQLNSSGYTYIWVALG